MVAWLILDVELLNIDAQARIQVLEIEDITHRDMFLALQTAVTRPVPR